MNILYIDTTTSYLYTGIVRDDKLITEIKEDFGKDLSKMALKKISEMLISSNLCPSDIDKIIVVNGPGSFTGIRVGVTIAKTFAYSLKKKITTVSSLEVMALSSNSQAKYIIPFIDARRGYVYAGIYDNENNIVLKEQYIKVDTLKCAVTALVDTFQYIGSSNMVDVEVENYNPNILKIVNTFKDKEDLNSHAVNPIYLKLTEAEEKQNLELI